MKRGRMAGAIAEMAINMNMDPGDVRDLLKFVRSVRNVDRRGIRFVTILKLLGRQVPYQQAKELILTAGL